MSQYRTPSLNKSRLKLILGTIPFFLLLAAIALGSWQLKQVREFFGRASGEPANILVDTTAVLGTMPRPWQNLAQGGEDHNWRMSPSVISGVKAIRPEYIRIDHIYDFYDIVQGTSGNLSFNFTKLDAVLDDIKATGAKPYIALSYMPPAIASGDITSKPTRWEDWQLVVQKTIEHISGKRGTADVYYEVWNEPDLFGGWKTYGDKNYLTLYEYAIRGANAANSKVKPFKIGGPATTALYKNWFDALAKHTAEKNLRMDFFSWHRYTNDLDQYKKDMVEVQSWVRAYPQLESTLEFQITEWGHDSDMSPGYDNNYGAAHTVAGAIQMVGTVKRAFVFEIQDGKDPAGQKNWGRWGLFTHQDFGSSTKPRYSALKMLDSIGDQRLQLLGKGSWVKGLAAKGDEGQIQVVLSNFDPNGSHSEIVPITLQNIEPGTYQVTKRFLNGGNQKESLSTTSASLRFQVPMSVNNVSFIEVKKQ